MDLAPNPFNDSDVINKLSLKNMGASWRERSSKYKNWLLGVLQSKKCHRILDVACGKGVDSLFLLEQGMEIVSCDDAEAMLFYARSEKTRLGLKDWVVKRANWPTLSEELPDQEPFDAVLCLGASILLLLDLPPQLDLYRKCLTNFRKFLKPGGLLLIDHRNLDSMLDHGFVVNKNIYHKALDSYPGMSMKVIERDGVRRRVDVIYHMEVKNEETGNNKIEKVIIPMAPVHVRKFTALLTEMFGSNCKYSLYGDLELQEHVDTEDTAYFQHVVHE